MPIFSVFVAFPKPQALQFTLRCRQLLYFFRSQGLVVKIKEAKKLGSQEARKPRSQEAGKTRSQATKKPPSQKAQKLAGREDNEPTSHEAKQANSIRKRSACCCWHSFLSMPVYLCYARSLFFDACFFVDAYPLPLDYSSQPVYKYRPTKSNWPNPQGEWTRTQT